jgi:hypothetical protein
MLEMRDRVGQVDAATSAARKRVEAFLAAVERTSVDDLQMVALPPPDPTARTDRLDTVVAAAAAAGRTSLLTEARSRTRALILGAFGRRTYDPTWFGLNWGRSLGRSTDRAALLAAADDAAAGTVVEDLIDDAGLLEELTSPFQMAVAMRGTAPATNPNIRTSHAGKGWRVVMVVMLALTFAWELVGELLFLASLPFHRGT